MDWGVHPDPLLNFSEWYPQRSCIIMRTKGWLFQYTILRKALGPGMWLGVGVTPSLRVGLSGISHRQKWVREAGMWFHIGLPYPQRRRRVQ